MSEDIVREYEKLKQKSIDLAELIIKHDTHLQKVKQEVSDLKNEAERLSAEIISMAKAKKEAEASRNADLIKREDQLKIEQEAFLLRAEQVVKDEHKLEEESEFLQVKRDALDKDLDAYEEKKEELKEVMVAQDNALTELESLNDKMSAHNTKCVNEEIELQKKREVFDQKEAELNNLKAELDEQKRNLDERKTQTDALAKINSDTQTELDAAKVACGDEVIRVAQLEKSLIADREKLNSERKQLEHEKLQVEDKEIRLRNIIQQKGLEDRVNAGKKT